jgi:cbb3-type cytochrome oxidase cytochrome c subunit
MGRSVPPPPPIPPDAKQLKKMYEDIKKEAEQIVKDWNSHRESEPLYNNSMNIRNVSAAIAALMCLGAGIVMTFKEGGEGLFLFVAAWWFFTYIETDDD